ncbi:hypothetical protein SAMN06265784_101520 [Paraburkholderia susongensis]|uniref:Uncharacterized protein n=1 Tax=Paraburkholderia susongensis TaxID=1515439 RepID=A0A1X7IBK5_9BURK|nr:hypothetical protein SAMN06265784_101520 [Paraburkholderia susongensis]
MLAYQTVDKGGPQVSIAFVQIRVEPLVWVTWVTGRAWCACGREHSVAHGVREWKHRGDATGAPRVRSSRSAAVSRCGVLFCPLIAEASPQSTAAFQLAHAPFELGKVSRAGKVLIIKALFGAVEPAANLSEKEGKHNNLREIAYQ